MSIGPSAKDFKLKFVREVMERINKELAYVKTATLQGMIRAAIHVRRDMEDTPPKIPIDYGNLRASFFIVTTKADGDKAKGNKAFEGPDAGFMKSEHSRTVSQAESLLSIERNPAVVMGFSANYAVYVHENLEANFARPKKVGGKLTARRPGAGAKFFGAALARNERKILEIMAESAKNR